MSPIVEMCSSKLALKLSSSKIPCPPCPTPTQAQSSWLYGAGWGLRKLLNWIANRYENPKP